MIYYGANGRELAIQVASTLIRVSVTTSAKVKVTLPSTYGHKLCGLCGNFDGSSSNDLRTANGIYVPQDVNGYVQGALIAESYLVS